MLMIDINTAGRPREIVPPVELSVGYTWYQLSFSFYFKKYIYKGEVQL